MAVVHVGLVSTLVDVAQRTRASMRDRHFSHRWDLDDLVVRLPTPYEPRQRMIEHPFVVLAK